MEREKNLFMEIGRRSSPLCMECIVGWTIEMPMRK